VQTITELLRGVHIAAGFLALLTFAVPLIARKGGLLHRRVGWVYVYGMYVAAATALLIVPIRMIERPLAQWRGPVFLAYVALLSFTSARFGVGVLQQKTRTAPHARAVDLAVPGALLTAAVGLLILGAVLRDALLLSFAILGWVVAVPQIRVLRRAPTSKRWWLVEHLGAMLISTVATLTAFTVTNAHRFGDSNHLVFWLGPTIVLVPLMIYWRRLYEKPGARLAGDGSS
jgi:uncharacterized membrane protein